MDFHLTFPIPPADFEIQHGDPICLIGSCFSDSMSTHFSRSGFDVLSNPFGTLFHPSAIANSIEFALDDTLHPRLFQRSDLFFSWDAASAVFGTSEAEVREKFDAQRSLFAQYLKKAKLVVITFGTAWGYELTETQQIVANCHKMPATHFEKRLMSVEEEIIRWNLLFEKLSLFHPELRIVFTVSPVRHKKDGLVENNLSKARLIELVHRLTGSSGTSYFPAYEIVMDELRDYRFFKEDRVHPTDEAIQYVWNRFEETCFSDATRKLARKVRQLHLSFAHKSLHPDSIETRTHQAAMEEKLKELLREHPGVWVDF